jgi:hypothetical protein
MVVEVHTNSERMSAPPQTEQERQEESAAQLAGGAELAGLYPLGERWRETYENLVKERKT